MIKYSLLKETKDTWEIYYGDIANHFRKSYRHGLNIINTSPRYNEQLGRDINMKIIYGNGQSGKTSYLIQESIEYNYTIVCHDVREKHRIMSLSESLYGRRLPPPITYQDYLRGNYYGISTNGFLIDNINLFLESFSSHHIPTKGFTIRTYDN